MTSWHHWQRCEARGGGHTFERFVLFLFHIPAFHMQRCCHGNGLNCQHRDKDLNGIRETRIQTGARGTHGDGGWTFSFSFPNVPSTMRIHVWVQVCVNTSSFAPQEDERLSIGRCSVTSLTFKTVIIVFTGAAVGVLLFSLVSCWLSRSPAVTFHWHVTSCSTLTREMWNVFSPQTQSDPQLHTDNSVTVRPNRTWFVSGSQQLSSESQLISSHCSYKNWESIHAGVVLTLTACHTG